MISMGCPCLNVVDVLGRSPPEIESERRVWQGLKSVMLEYALALIALAMSGGGLAWWFRRVGQVHVSGGQDEM
jgi:hypothetical protein